MYNLKLVFGAMSLLPSSRNLLDIGPIPKPVAISMLRPIWKAYTQMSQNCEDSPSIAPESQGAQKCTAASETPGREDTASNTPAINSSEVNVTEPLKESFPTQPATIPPWKRCKAEQLLIEAEQWEQQDKDAESHSDDSSDPKYCLEFKVRARKKPRKNIGEAVRAYLNYS
jgi:hypothetical protein